MLSNLRIAGLASGIDTESIVKDLMRAHRIPVDKLQQNRQILEWRQEAYRNINVALRSFRDQVFNMRLQSTYLARRVSSSNESIVTTSANANALDGQHTILVSQLARGASVTSGTALGSSKNLTTLNSQFGTDHGLIELEINDVVFKFDAGSESINSVLNRINKHNAAGVSLNTTQKATGVDHVQIITLVDDDLFEGHTITVGDKKIALWDSTAGTYANADAAKAALGADYIYDLSNEAFNTADKIAAAIATETAPDGASWTKAGNGELKVTWYKPQVQEIRLVDDALVEGLTITAGDKKIALWDSSAGTYANADAAKTALGADYIYDLSDAAFDTADKIVAAIAAENAPTGASWVRSDTGELRLTSTGAGISNAVSATVTGGKKWHVQASYDATLDRFFLSTSATGENQHLKITDTTLSQLLKLTDGTGTLDTSDLNDFPDGDDGPKTVKGAVAGDGRNARVTVDGMEINDYAGNQFTLNGVAYTLHNTSASAVTVTVQRDTDALFEQVTGFVEQYNSIVDTITDLLYEKKYADYPPLTNEQREQLSEEQIKKWEDKARSGILRNDTFLSSLASRLRQAMSGVVPGLDSAYNALADIGIATTADYMSAKLEVNETKLREALQKNPEAVMDLFTKSSDNYSEKGIAQRLYDDITNGMNRIIDQAGSYNEYALVDNSLIGKRLSDIDNRIDNWENRLLQIENRYWRQFTAMEQAIQRLNTQSAWLSQQFNMYSQQ